MIKAAIVEDDRVYISYLENLLLQWSEARTEPEISGYTDGLKLLHTAFDVISDYDIIFIDIELQELNGIELAAELRGKGFQNTIVFVTNYEKYAIEGYRVNAYRYYLKPPKPQDINECMNFVLDSISEVYFQYFYHGVTNRIPFQSIVCFESMQHYIHIYTRDSVIRIKYSLKKVLEQSPSYFIRCHRSYIVNKNYIRCRMGNRLILTNNKRVEVSRIYSGAVSYAMNSGSGDDN